MDKATYLRKVGEWQQLETLSDEEIVTRHNLLKEQLDDATYDILRRRSLGGYSTEELSWAATRMRMIRDAARPHQPRVAQAMNAALDALDKEARTRDNPVKGQLNINSTDLQRATMEALDRGPNHN